MVNDNKICSHSCIERFERDEDSKLKSVLCEQETCADFRANFYNLV